MTREIAITGVGSVSALGSSVAALWSAIADGHCGVSAVQRFATDELNVHTAALVGDADPSDTASALCRTFALCAAREAIASAGLAGPGGRTALVLGTGLADGGGGLDALVEAVGDELGIDGPRLGVSTACSSSTGALGLGCELLALGAADVVVAGGADVVSPEVFAGFHALGVLAPRACAPFSTPAGTTLGEGAGFLVLERGPSARLRGATIRGWLTGYGLSADAWHETSPDPKGKGIERAIRAALADAGLQPQDVGYVNAHGSGTQANDSAEWLGISRALGPERRDVPVSSTKGALGHAQGAAGVLEAIVTLEGMSRDLLPPTLNFATPRPHGPVDPVPGPRPRPCRYDCAVSVNSAFGGANAAVVLSRASRGATEPRPRSIMLRGLAVCGGRDTVAIEDLVPSADPRGLDPASKLLTASGALALRDAGLVLAGDQRNRCGLFVGQCRPSPASLRAFSSSIAERGLARLSAPAFARIVLNAAAGFCSMLLGVRGPLTVLTAGPASGLAALVLAAHCLASRDDADLMLAASVHEDEREPEAGTESLDRAVSVLLGAEVEGGGSPGNAVRIVGWGLAAPGRRDDAVARAAPAGVPGQALCLDVREGPATAGLSLLATAVRALRDGTARSAIVTADSGQLLAAVHLSL